MEGETALRKLVRISAALRGSQWALAAILLGLVWQVVPPAAPPTEAASATTATLTGGSGTQVVRRKPVREERRPAHAGGQYDLRHLLRQTERRPDGAAEYERRLGGQDHVDLQQPQSHRWRWCAHDHRDRLRRYVLQ